MIKHSKNYSKIIGSLCNYNRDEVNSGVVGKINYTTKDWKSFNLKKSITWRLEGNNTEKEVEIDLPWKHLSNFWKTLDMPLINCEINLIIAWSEKSVITSKTAKDADSEADPAVVSVKNKKNAAFKIIDKKLYLPVVTLSTEDDNTVLEKLKTGCKRTIKWNKYRREMSKQTKTNNLSYLVDSTFNKVNRLFALLLVNKDDRASFSKYYTPSVEIKDFNILIDGKNFFTFQ